MTDYELIRAAERGDMVAFKQLYGAYNEMAVRIAARVTGSTDDGEDAAAEMWLWLFEGRWRVDADVMADHTAHRFIATLARLAAFKQIQHSGVLGRALHDSTSPVFATLRSPIRDPESLAISRQFWRQFHRVSRGVTARHRRVAELRYVDELALRDIGRRVGMTHGTACRFLREFRGAFRSGMADYVDVPTTYTRTRKIPIGAPRPTPRGCSIHSRECSPSTRTTAGDESPTPLVPSSD